MYALEKLAQRCLLWCVAIVEFLNITLHLFVWHTNLWDVFVSILYPVLLVGGMYFFSFELKLCIMPRRATRCPIFWNIVIIAVTALFVMLLHDEDEINVATSILPVYALSVLPYLYRRQTHSMIAIVLTSALFACWCGVMACNTAAVIVIVISTVGLLLAYPSLDWFWPGQNLQKKSIAAIMIYSAVVGALLATPVMVHAFEFAAMGRPGLGSSTALNEQCVALFEGAKLFGKAELGYSRYIFYDRVFAAVLAEFGYMAWVAFLLICGVMLLSGWYLAVKRFHIQKFYIVAAYTLLFTQTVGCFLTCCGYDRFLFPEVMPLMSDGILENVAFLLMVAVVIRPKQSVLPKSAQHETE